MNLHSFTPVLPVYPLALSLALSLPILCAHLLRNAFAPESLSGILVLSFCHFLSSHLPWLYHSQESQRPPQFVLTVCLIVLRMTF